MLASISKKESKLTTNKIISYRIVSYFVSDYSCKIVTLVLSLGHQTMHVIPVLGGVPHLHNARRINLGKKGEGGGNKINIT